MPGLLDKENASYDFTKMPKSCKYMETGARDILKLSLFSFIYFMLLHVCHRPLVKLSMTTFDFLAMTTAYFRYELAGYKMDDLCHIRRDNTERVLHFSRVVSTGAALQLIAYSADVIPGSRLLLKTIYVTIFCVWAYLLYAAMQLDDFYDVDRYQTFLLWPVTMTTKQQRVSAAFTLLMFFFKGFVTLIILKQDFAFLRGFYRYDVEISGGRISGGGKKNSGIDWSPRHSPGNSPRNYEQGVQEIPGFTTRLRDSICRLQECSRVCDARCSSRAATTTTTGGKKNESSTASTDNPDPGLQRAADEALKRVDRVICEGTMLCKELKKLEKEADERRDERDMKKSMKRQKRSRKSEYGKNLVKLMDNTRVQEGQESKAAIVVPATPLGGSKLGFGGGEPHQGEQQAGKGKNEKNEKKQTINVLLYPLHPVISLPGKPVLKTNFGFFIGTKHLRKTVWLFLLLHIVNEFMPGGRPNPNYNSERHPKDCELITNVWWRHFARFIVASACLFFGLHLVCESLIMRSVASFDFIIVSLAFMRLEYSFYRRDDMCSIQRTPMEQSMHICYLTASLCALQMLIFSADLFPGFRTFVKLLYAFASLISVMNVVNVLQMNDYFDTERYQTSIIWPVELTVKQNRLSGSYTIMVFLVKGFHSLFVSKLEFAFLRGFYRCEIDSRKPPKINPKPNR